MSIVGSDVNASAIESARTATYREWSLRTCGAVARERYFVETDDGYVLKQPFRDAVSFAFHNLVDPRGGAPQGAPFDLVLCRNVAIYLDEKALRRTFSKLCSVLAPDGFLVVGASDPAPPPELGLRFCNIRGVVAFRCQGKPGSRTESISRPIDFDSDHAAKRIARASGSEP